MKKPNDIKICLNGMVGNEEATISRMLESVADYIDYYVIQCNGNDKTRQIIDEFFIEREIPGFTYQIEWNYPGWNRDHTLQTCLQTNSVHKCDWILRMDADEQLKVEDDFDWSIFRDTTIPAFNIVADPGDSLYYRTWLWNAKLPWYFAHDRRHETIWLPDLGEDFSRVNLSKGFRHIITNDGETWFAPMKFLKDALELESDKVTSSKVLEDNYHLWYIGKSYHDACNFGYEFPFKDAHVKEYSRRSIFYFEMYLNMMHDYSNAPTAKFYDEMGYYALFLMGKGYERLGEFEKAIEFYDQASVFDPYRNEARYEKTVLLENLGRYDEMRLEAYTMINPKSAVKNPFPTSCFLISNRVYYDTSYEPFVLYIKSLNFLNLPIAEAIDQMLSIHDDVPVEVLKQLKPEPQITSNEDTVSNLIDPLTVDGAFGITQ